MPWPEAATSKPRRGLRDFENEDEEEDDCVARSNGKLERRKAAI